MFQHINEVHSLPQIGVNQYTNNSYCVCVCMCVRVRVCVHSFNCEATKSGQLLKEWKSCSEGHGVVS